MHVLLVLLMLWPFGHSSQNHYQGINQRHSRRYYMRRYLHILRQRERLSHRLRYQES